MNQIHGRFLWSSALSENDGSEIRHQAPGMQKTVDQFGFMYK